MHAHAWVFVNVRESLCAFTCRPNTYVIVTFTCTFVNHGLEMRSFGWNRSVFDSRAWDPDPRHGVA